MYHVPYTSLTVHLSTLSRDVDSGTMYRVISETLAILVAAVLTKVIEPISEYFADYCGDNREGVCVYSGMGGIQLGYMAQAAIISALCVISGIGVLVTIGEQKVPPGGHAPPASFTEGFMTVIRTPSFRSLTMLFIWIWMGVAIIQANLLLYVQIVLGKPFSVATDLILVQLGVCVLSEPFWFLVMIEFGKKRTFILSLSLTIPVIFGLYFLDDGTPVWLLRLVFGIFGLSIAAVYLVPAAMTPDVINQAALREGGQRKEALFYSYSVLFQKFAAGIALFVSNELLESVGDYDSKSESNDQAKPVLRLLMSVIPGTFGILSVLFALCYPLTTEKERQIKESLDRMVDGKMAESISAPQLTNVTRGAPVVDLVRSPFPRSCQHPCSTLSAASVACMSLLWLTCLGYVHVLRWPTRSRSRCPRLSGTASRRPTPNRPMSPTVSEYFHKTVFIEGELSLGRMA
jgi:Na+/melibiose symporter-like transporter